MSPSNTTPNHPNTNLFRTGILLLVGILLFGIYGVVAHGLEGKPEYETNQDYIEECGACHLAYAPDLLPVESWQQIMLGLEDHFGDNAELDQETSDILRTYLETHGLSRGRASKMSRLLRGVPSPPPRRITELPAFLNMHYSVPRQLGVTELKEGYLSPCADCHRQAAEGIYDAERLHPGYGPANWGGEPSDPD